MPWSLFVIAIGLMLVFEGILPFSSPRYWRNWMQQMLNQSDTALRIVGLMSMLLGLFLITIVHTFFS